MGGIFVQEVFDFLKKAGTYYIATADGDQPRVRPFATALLMNGRIYIQTGKVKPCSKQMAVNPKVEICAINENSWLRIAATVINDDSIEVKRALLDAYPQLKGRYSAEDENMQMLYLSEAVATFFSFTTEPKVVQF